MAQEIGAELDLLLNPGSIEGLSIRDIKELEKIVALGGSCITPDDWRAIFKVKDIGKIAPIPSGLTAELLKGEKYDFKKHILCYIPTHIGDKPFNLINFNTEATRAGEGLKRGKIFFSSAESAWYRRQLFATSDLTTGEWAYLLKTYLPGTGEKTYADQESVVGRDSSYKTAKVTQLITPIIMHDLKYGGKRQIFTSTLGFCEDQTIADPDNDVRAGRRVVCGYFFASGLNVDSADVGYSHSNLGRAVLRKF